MTTGRIRMGSSDATASDAGNYNYNYSADGFKQSFTGYPDSISFWASFYATGSGSNQGNSAFSRISVIIYNGDNDGNDMRDPIPSSSSYQNRLVATLEKEFQRTTSSNNIVWQRFAKEFDYEVPKKTNSAAYIMITITNNKVPVSGTESDRLYMDDIEMIYNGIFTDIKLDGTTIPSFNQNTYNYTVDWCEGKALPTITATAQSEIARTKNQVTITDPTPENNYTATINRKGSTINYTVHFNIIPAPTAPTASAPAADCSNTAHPVSLTASSPDATSYRWYNVASGGSDLGATGSSYLTPNISGSATYYVSAVNNAGCESGRTAVTATVNLLPNVSISPVNALCAGQSATLTANGASTYNWNNGLGVGNNKSVSPNTNTTYTVTGTDANGCTNTASVNVTVNPLPTVSISPVNELCAGQSATLTANGANTYSWDNGLGEGNDKQVSPENTTTYTVTGTDNKGCTKTASVSVTVNPLPNVSISPVNALCAGQSTTLTANGANTYSWDNELGEDNNIEVSPENTTTYTVTGTDNNGCTKTASVSITVNPNPSAPVCQNDTLCGRGQAILTAELAEHCNCQWFNTNYIEITSGISNETKTLTTSNLTQHTIYHVRSVNPSTNCFSANTDVQVIIAPIPDIPAASNKARCGAGTLTLTATPGSNADNCRWYNANDEFLYKGTSYTTDHLEGTTTFHCKSYNSVTGCESTDYRTVTATINPIPDVPTVSGNHPLCGSGSLQMTGTPGTNATICRWINGNDTTTNNNFSTGDLSQSINYLVQSYNANTRCFSENTPVAVVVNPLPGAPQTGNDTQCLGTEVTLTATAAEENIAFRWYASANDNTILAEGTQFHPTNLIVGENNFYAEAYNTLTSCTSAERTLAIATAIDAPAIPNVADTVHCGPAAFTLSIINPQDNTTYKWYTEAQGGEVLHTGTSYTTEELSATTRYYVSAAVANYDCESGRKEVTVTINSIPANPEISGNKAICAGQTLTVSASSDAAATNFVWSDGQNNSEGESFTTPVLSENASYTAKAYNANTHCESEVVNFTVTVNPNPAAPGVSPVALCQNETVVLSAAAETGNTCYWYASEDSEESVATGDSYSPTNVSVGNTTFYVSQRNNETQCEGARAAVVATIYPVYEVNYPVTACDSFQWNNETFRESGNYERTLHTQHDCDSVVTLQLTINHSQITHIDTTVCDLFTWNGQTYETSGDYQQSFHTVQNCDSTVYVHLTVKKSTVGEDHIYLCSNELPYNYNDLQSISAAGDYTLHTTNAAGCDSTINLTVTVNTQPSLAISLTPAARCGEGSVKLTAHAGQNGSTCRWYADETSTEVLNTGTEYTTNSLTASTTFYVSSYNDYNGHPCESGRQAITATINTNPAEPTVADQVRCGSGQVEFTATIDENATTCRWYLTQNTTDINATSLTYTPNINVSNSSKSFYVESYNSGTGCKSGRKEVKATAFTIPSAPVLDAMSHCGPDVFSINAPANGYYKWYNSEESTETLDINNNTTPTVENSRSYFISHAVDYTGISCESDRTELALTIYPVYQPQHLYDTLCQGASYKQHGLNETFSTAGPFDRVINTVSSTYCDSLVTLHLWVKEIRYYEFEETVCDSYTWNNETFTTSENITRHFTSSIGCDSVVTLHLTVNKSVQNEFSDIACDEYQWNEETYTTSGDYVQHFNTVNGCDSMVTLHLTINHSAQTEFSEIACDSYQWNNETYTQSGDYVQHFNTVKGCDSTATLHLTVNYSNAVTMTDDVCAGTEYNANGFDTLFTTAGSYTLVRHDLNQAGCDSTTTLILKVNPIYNQNVTLTICETALPYTWNDITYPTGTASGDYTHTYNTQTAMGCDSIVTLHLTISNQYITPLTADICEGETYPFAGHALNQSGVYYDTLLATNHCDSIIKLTLTVHELHTTSLEANICLGETYTGYDFNVTPETIGLNTFERHVQTSFDCDSTIILNLTVNPVYSDTDYVTVCANSLPITWQGREISQAGHHIAEYQTVNGCDSIHYLMLTVNPNYFISETASTCYNEAYVWEGHSKQIGLLDAGEHIIWDSLKTVNDCDSVYKLTLTVHRTFYEEMEDTTCANEVYVWEGHEHVNIGLLEAGEHIIWDSLKTVNGCDSVYKLTLTVHRTFYEEMYATTCKNTAYVWEGHNKQIDLLPVGDHIIWDSLKTMNGCDSVYKLILTVTPIFYEEETATTCDNETYIWEGHNKQIGMLTAGTYTFWDSLSTATYHCDSIYKLTLTVNPTKHTDIYETICERSVYEYNDNYYEEQGDYDFTFQTALDCDSTVTLHLTVNPVFEKDTTINICEGVLPYSFADTMFYGTSHKDIFLHTQHGCDSIYHVQLNVTPFTTSSQTINICDNGLPYDFEDSTFNEAGVYEVTITHDDGCNEIITLTLNVSPTYDITVDTTVCDLFVWNGQTYTESDTLTYTYRLPTACDSTVTVYLTVNHSKDTTLRPVICQGESYELNGFSIQTESDGMVYDTLHLQCVGTTCDSTVYLELTINPTYNDTLTNVVCDSMVWNNQTYTVSGFHTQYFRTINDCDSIVTYNLTVNPSYNHSFDTTVCDLFVWEGQNYTESGTLTHTYTLATDCDSTVTFHLTVNHSKDTTLRPVICQGESYELNGFSIQTESDGMVYDTLHLQCVGTTCDSTVYLELTVNPSHEINVRPVTICQGDTTFKWGGRTITEAGLYTYTVDNEYNCHDVYKLVVTVDPVYNFSKIDTVCSNELPYLWQGREIHQPGDYTAEYHTVNNGCDSIYTLTLTVNPSYEQTFDTSVCDLFVWDGRSYTQSEILTHTYTLATGCDSTVTINLTVNHSKDSVIRASICQGEDYHLNGFEISQAEETGIIYDTLHLACIGTECDSTVYLELTVNPSWSHETETDTICVNEEYVWTGHEHIQIGQLEVGSHTIYDELYTTNGCDSSYTLILTVNPTAHSIENASSCSNEEVYKWHGQDITATGIYYDTLSTILGCDSVCELRYTLLEPTAAVFTDTICANAPYRDYGFDITPVTSGDTTLVRVTENAVNCDSTITVNLHVKPVATFSFDTIVCNAFFWNNLWYTESGEYQKTFTAANGCDSIVTFNLTIDKEEPDTIRVIACDSYEWEGTTYTQSREIIKHYPQAVGCDSVVVMILTINHATEVTLYDTTCQGHRYQEFGFDTLLTTQIGTLNLQRIDTNTVGCDSIINLMLTVHRGYVDIDSTSTCDNSIYNWHGILCDTTGWYVKNYETIHGCDSVFMMYLTINPSYEIDVTDTAIAGTAYHNHGLNFTPQNPGTLTIPVPGTTVDGCDSTVNVTLIVVEATGIDLHYLDNRITLFPNPTENVFTVNSTMDIIRELTIFDNNGKAVLQQSVNDYSGQVNVEHLAPGIYFVRLTTPNHLVTKKLIVR